MAYLEPSMVHYRSKVCGMQHDRVEAGWLDLVDRITGAAPGC
ncbi:hypothetical protein [Streptomyces sp. NPDC003635]